MMIDKIITFKFLKMLTTPFSEWDAYNAGIIDERGNVLQKNARSDSFNSFDLLVCNIKKILQKLPGGGNKLASYAAALYLIKEHADSYDNFNENILTEMVNKMTGINEDAPTNSVGGGHIAGVNADTINDIIVVDKDKIKERKREDEKNPKNMTHDNLADLAKDRNVVGFKEAFKLKMSEILAENTILEKANLTADEKEKLMAAIFQNKKTKDISPSDKEKSNLYVWQTSEATSEKIKKVVDDYNDTHPHQKLTARLFKGATLTRMFVSGELQSRKQVENDIESAGAKRQK